MVKQLQEVPKTRLERELNKKYIGYISDDLILTKKTIKQYLKDLKRLKKNKSL